MAIPKLTIQIDSDWFSDQFKRAGLTQSEVASRLGIDKGGMSRLISGKRKMKLEEATVIASLIGKDIDHVLKRALGLVRRKE